MKQKQLIKMGFSKTEGYSPKNESEKKLISAFLRLKSEREVANFLRDLMTPSEIGEFSNRLAIASLLLKGQPYLKIAKSVHVSTTTVSRVAHWLFHGCGGYWKILQSSK